MELFYKNISRYPKFLLVTICGLCFLLFTPLLNFTKKNPGSPFTFFLAINGVLAYFIFKEMFNV